jgi:hypothetical protein
MKKRNCDVKGVLFKTATQIRGGFLVVKVYELTT